MPSRLRSRSKRPARAGRFRPAWPRTYNPKSYLYALSLLLACALAAALYLNGCRKSKAPRRVVKERKIDALAVTNRLKSAMERTGGSRIWIKRSARPSAAKSGVAGEALAVPSSFEALLIAVRRESDREGLQARITNGLSPGRWRSVEVEILNGAEPVCSWRLREVLQIHRVAIIIDDLGVDLSAAHQLLRLPYALTFSVMPNLPHSVQIADEAHGAGREVMLHLPMQPEAGSLAKASPDELEVGMTAPAVRRTLEADLVSVPGARGVNNHMGSRATADMALMTELMRVLSERHLYFVDSRTTPDSVALDVARRMRIPAFYRSVFLDDIQTTTYTLGQLQVLRRVLEEQGTAIAIGHPHPTTLRALAQFLPQLEKDDIQLLPASQLVRLPETARLWPPRGKPVQAKNSAPPPARWDAHELPELVIVLE